MLNPRFLFCFFCFFLFSSVGGITPVFAQSRSVESGDVTLFFERIHERAHFSIGTEVVQVDGAASSILGVGPRTGFEYGLNEKLSLGANMSFQFQATGKPGALFYSGINGLIRYAFKGSSVKQTETITRKDGSFIYSSRPSAKRRISGFVGLEQLFLNGKTSIYPAVGATLGGAWGFSLWGYETAIDARYTALTANDNPLTMIAIGSQVNLDF